MKPSDKNAPTPVEVWLESLTLLALGRVPKPSVEELRTMAKLLAAATDGLSEGTIRRTVMHLSLHLTSDFMPSPAVILGSIRAQVQPLDTEQLYKRIRRAYFQDELALTPRRLADHFPEAADRAAVEAMQAAVGTQRLLDHALHGTLHPVEVRRMVDAAQAAIVTLPLAEPRPQLPAHQAKALRS